VCQDLLLGTTLPEEQKRRRRFSVPKSAEGSMTLRGDGHRAESAQQNSDKLRLVVSTTTCTRNVPLRPIRSGKKVMSLRPI
jgi:hypothetical protein